MTTEAKAAVLLSTSVDFLATKHGVSAQEIVAKLAAKDAKIMGQWAELVSAAIAAGA